MNETSDCLSSFGYADFDPGRVARSTRNQCPVRDCDAQLMSIQFGKTAKGPRLLPCCPKHGLRLHSGTFVYWNGPGRNDAARLRNFIVRRDLAASIALAGGKKAESHRLGYEMSEDALSWNVFVSLVEVGKLREAATHLTGRKLRNEPRLYLWGRPIMNGEDGVYPPLQAVRQRLEPDIRTFVTEPDIMLVADGEMVICIEAKFGSGNPLAHEGKIKAGEKPVTREGLLGRYVRGGVERVIDADRIGAAPRSQLLRNVVFAAAMAGEGEWHVVNLVASTLRGKSGPKYSFDDPTEEIADYLRHGYRHCFTYRTWEDLHANCVAGDPKLSELDRYLREKSAHYRRAFELE